MSLKEQAVIAMIKECIQPLLELKKGFEKQENRADDITEGLPVEKYPSVNAVINFVKNKITDFSNNLNTVYVKLSDFDVYKKDVKTSFGNFEKGVTDTYATKTIVEDLKNDTEVTRTASGSAITVNSASAPLQNLRLFGKTEQNGTPTPDAPVPLVSVGDSGSFWVGVYGRNLFDGLLEQKTTVNENTSMSRIRSKTLIPVIAGCKYTITKKGDNSNAFKFAINTNPAYIKGYPLDARLTTICGNSQNWQNGNSYSFVATQNGVMTLLFREDPDATSITIDKMKNIKFQVELGDSTPYEPYKEKQILTIPYALRSVSDIKDEVDFMRGVYCGKIFNKSLTDFHLSQHIYTSENYLVATILETGYALKSVCLSTHFEMISDGMLGKSTGVYIYVSSTNKTAIHISIPKTIASDTTALKQWLIDNDVKFYYPLATPIETPLTETELNAYRHLMTNKGTTTVLSEADMEVDYYINKPNAQAIGNIHTQVNEGYFKLQQAIITTGGN